MLASRAAVSENGRYEATRLSPGPWTAIGQLEGSDRAGRKEVTLSGVTWAPKSLG